MSESAKNQVEAAIEAGERLGKAAMSTSYTEVNGVIVGPRSVQVLTDVMAARDALAPAPRRREGTAVLHEQQSFIDHVNRFKSDHTAIFAASNKLTAIYDYHPEGPEVTHAAWRRHQAVYVCPFSEEFHAWRGKAGNWLSLDAFAEFVEERFDDIASEKGYPDRKTVLMLARDFEHVATGTVTRRRDPRTGDYTMTSKVATDEKKSTTVPSAFLIAVPIYAGGDLRAIEARIRLKVDQGNPSIAFDLHRVNEHIREAFAKIREEVAAATELPVFAGAAES